ncbi:ubiquinone biosynthesis regulatory protein kinase UbiB [Blochmannia endosymbiont of Camponotus sp.]|uniref:ubiquinone biosynthesis regulatory protein kinase UbiB n=1 Tax=Blochmannia endosymbiont of Camponotus sp. TaxID=700220 RepID=UPI002025A2A2|nr:ubiquinone biosynthesis regulatory protein kinase UbiB [Blochmannia endosymbiont of Camponotus sp.]URJ25880.1 ubiquinone biosynthesis regulatory protein kinase UbiB [Blochmannia endosymbiont of Camponotus sp.]
MLVDELSRLYSIIKTILNYGLSDFVPTHRLIFPLRIGSRFLLRVLNKHAQLTLGERCRLALQELGPIWIKFGQMLSTRRDIFSDAVADQLSILQDRVAPFDGIIAKTYIERAIGNSLETWFKDFQEVPLASASISQVHSAKLKKNNKDIVIKIIRPGLLPIIKIDICLMYRLAKWIYKFLPEGRKFKFSEVVSEYEKTLFNELNLLKETANTIQLRRNFKKSQILYIPKVYVDFCSENVMVMERIYGIPVYDVVALKKQKTNMKLLAERGIEIFFTQIFRDSFFHGDMHPGNIFISYKHPENPKYICVDCGIVGSLNKKDKYYLAANFIAFFNRDYRKIAELHLDSGWIPFDTNIEDFECAMRTVFEPIFEQPLEKIPFSKILLYLFNTARYFNMEIQPQLILLQKTLLYIEGIVRQLYPNLNLWKSAQPFLERWMQDQLKLSTTICTLKDKIPHWIDKIPELPTLLSNEFKRSCMLQKKIEILIRELRTQRTNHGQALFLFGVGATLVTSSIFLYIQDKYLKIFSIFLFVIGIFIWTIGWKRIIQ